VSGLRALPLVLIITTGSTSAFAPGSDRPESARPSELRSSTKLTCFPIRPGDTAARLAQRITGSMYNRHQVWFQIVDPSTATVIPKSRYDEIESGWHVCVATDMLRRGLAQPQYLPIATAGVAVPQTNVPQGMTGIRPIDLSILWWVTPLFVAVAGVGLVWAWRGLEQRRVRLEVMRGFGERFLREFERPLRRNATSPPVKTRVRFAPARLRVDIFIAPAGGRTYPNLVDHKRNIEYDVERVMRLLKDASFVNGPLYAQGSWVVIPCRFETNRQQEGAS
jgi:hypothetical protein